MLDRIKANRDELSNYLPLSGGTVKTLVVGNGNAYMLKDANGTMKGGLAYTNKIPQFVIGNWEKVVYAFHSGNSRPVAIQSTEPIDTTTLWVDTSTKSIKCYMNGTWQELSY